MSPKDLKKILSLSSPPPLIKSNINVKVLPEYKKVST
jgi:hypothetical protein